MFTENKIAGTLDVTTGVLEDPENFVKIADHQHVEATIDGGFSAWLPTLGAKFLPRWSGTKDATELLPLEWPCPLTREKLPKSSVISCYCHCKGVNFTLTRPDSGSEACTAPFPDVMKNDIHEEGADSEKTKWWLSGDGRYAAGTCACRSCRLASGLDIVEVCSLNHKTEEDAMNVLTIVSGPLCHLVISSWGTESPLAATLVPSRHIAVQTKLRGISVANVAP